MVFASTMQSSVIRNVCSHLRNLFNDVKQKLVYRMRLEYAHLPINADVINGGKFLEIFNYLDEKFMHTVIMIPRIIVEKTYGAA